MSENDGGTTRRDFLQGGLAVAGSALATSSLATSMTGVASAQTAAKKPNLIFIYGEGQRWDAMSCAGNEILKTPHHDRIAHEGVRFTNAFCTNSLCAPARATALTGLYSKTSGAKDNQGAAKVPLPKDIPLFTETLREAGYEIAIVGKIHVRNGVKDRYWDYYFGFNAPMTNYYNPRFAEGRNGVIGEEKVYRGQYADDLVTDRAISWMNEKRDKPFCLLLWFQTPHAPFFRARRHLDLYSGVKIPKPATFDDDLKGYPGKSRAFAEAENKIGTFDTGDACRTLEEVVKDYYAGLTAVDENIGRVFTHLEKTKELDDTAILHTSDHGYFLGEWRCYDKRLMHEPSIRVPMMVRYPKRIKPGTLRNEMVLDLDIAPTLLDLAGVKIPDHLQGKSMVPLANGGDASWRKEWFYDYYEYPGNEQVRPHRGIRTETAKLMHYYLDPEEFEMYDLAKDPGELKNLYGDPQHAAMQADLKARLEKLRNSIPERPGNLV